MNLLSKLFYVVLNVVNFPTAILDRLGLINGEVTYKLRNNNLKFIARAGTEDLAEIAMVATGKEYPMKLINLPHSPVIFDLGGYIGDFSIPTAFNLKNKCKIYAYEPDAGNYKILLKNIALNKIKSVISRNIAISSYVGKGHLKNVEINTDAYHLDSSSKETNCAVSTLINESKKNKIKQIDLLKVDVEGGEYDILQHKESLDFINKNVHYIFIEHHPVSKKLNGELVKKILIKNFNILEETINTFTLENRNWKLD